MTRLTAALTAVTALTMALLRIGALVDRDDWYGEIGVALAGGMILAWIVTSTRLPTTGMALIHLVAAALWSNRVILSQTTEVETFLDTAVVYRELGYGMELLRFGAAPVLAVPGLIGIIALVCWLLAALVTTAVRHDRPVSAIAPPLVFYLQLATVERRPSSPAWMIALAVVVAGLVLAVGHSPGAGRVGDENGHHRPSRSTGLALITFLVIGAIGVAAPGMASQRIPPGGTIRWRAPTGMGGIFGGGSTLDPFVGLHQSVIDQRNETVFIATLSESAPPGDTIYWNLITLDHFDGTNWLPTALPIYRGGEQWEDPAHRFTGPTVPVSARVRIADMGGQLLPTIYSPTSLTSPVKHIQEGFLVRSDGSVRLDLTLRPNWEYEIQADLPQPDLANLATHQGAPSPIFANAGTVFAPRGFPAPFAETPLPNRSMYTALPRNTPAGIARLSRELTRGAVTSFEEAVLLEAFFRDSDLFTYSTDVSTGHSSLDLQSWLTDPISRNFRTGYCEQFATAMAVMARTLDIPSRVVLGYAPGLVGTQADGSEIIEVSRHNAHAWVELWMDGQGWVRFDPTPRGDGINPATVDQLGFDPRLYLPDPARATGDPSTRTPVRDGLNLPAEDFRDFSTGGGQATDAQTRLPWFVPVVAGLAMALATVPTLKWLGRRRRLRRIRDGDITAAWEEITLHLAGLGEPVLASETPLELADRVDRELEPLATLMTAVICEGAVEGEPLTSFDRAERAVGRRGGRWQRLGRWMIPLAMRKR